ncbi:MAG: transketolase [Myxococcales bacterium]|nr:transketolase [Myxococcales bacterium]
MTSRVELANAIRVLSMDAVQKANSGHPGMPMGMADMAEVLWNDFLRHNPKHPEWPNRDRFVLSNGHGSMLLYSLLHLTGYALPMEELENFRQLHSMTPGHPEYGMTPGVETTTGPLGQGVATAVGMALAEKMMAAHFNRDGFPVVDHHTYVFLGDGCLMEGISHEACSLAGTWKLGKLVALYDDNGISIDGEVEGWFTDDTPKRFESYGWHVIRGVDGHDADAIQKAIEAAKAETHKPTLICCKTVIGFGAPNLAGTEKTHGSPLGAAEVAAAREKLGWTAAPFVIPEPIAKAWDATERGQAWEDAWDALFAGYREAHPTLAQEWDRRIEGVFPTEFEEKTNTWLAKLQKDGKVMASRKASQAALEFFCSFLPEMIGGSADLTGSNNTNWSGSKSLTAEGGDANYIHYGVREFAMAAIMNGLSLYGGIIPYGGTFLVFSDYLRNALRLSALMQRKVIHVLTHDSIGLGEDGPTHQPVEHLSALQVIPNVSVWRPCDTVETAIAWKVALLREDGPTCLALSRQNLAHQARSDEQMASVERGGYVLQDCEGKPEVLLISTGSEVEVTRLAAKQLADAGRKVRMISMPSLDTFMNQDEAYRESVLPEGVAARVVVEAGSSMRWGRVLGLRGKMVGMDSFGESAPGELLLEHFGFNVGYITEQALSLLS